MFAVGIILWEMFTGRRLFYGETDYQTVELVRQARVPSIAALNPEVEPELEAVVRKALARDPERPLPERRRPRRRARAVPVLAAHEGDVARHRARWCRRCSREEQRAQPKARGR